MIIFVIKISKLNDFNKTILSQGLSLKKELRSTYLFLSLCLHELKSVKSIFCTQVECFPT